MIISWVKKEVEALSWLKMGVRLGSTITARYKIAEELIGDDKAS